MFEQWTTDEDMGHGSLVPVVVLWIVWRERGRWRALPAQPNGWGFAILAAGAVIQALAALGGGLFAGSVAFLVSVAVIIAGVAPLVEAEPHDRALILFWTLAAVVMAGLVYVVVRAVQGKK